MKDNDVVKYYREKTNLQSIIRQQVSDNYIRVSNKITEKYELQLRIVVS